jgi:hypothetical protein
MDGVPYFVLHQDDGTAKALFTVPSNQTELLMKYPIACRGAFFDLRVDQASRNLQSASQQQNAGTSFLSTEFKVLIPKRRLVPYPLVWLGAWPTPITWTCREFLASSENDVVLVVMRRERNKLVVRFKITPFTPDTPYLFITNDECVEETDPGKHAMHLFNGKR